MLVKAEADAWRNRWFVKPELTGLAQINDASSAEPEEKLRYDLLYIRQQSFWFDMMIVVRQLWGVGRDAVGFVLPGGGVDSSESFDPDSGSTLDAGEERGGVDESTEANGGK